MPHQTPDTISLSWDSDAVWVQRTAYLMLLDTLDGDASHPDGRDSLHLRRQNGETFVSSRAEITAEYEPIQAATVFRPRHNPAQMLRFNDTATITLGTDTQPLQVGQGTVLIRSGDGTVTIIDEHVFRCNYTIVAAANARP